MVVRIVRFVTFVASFVLLASSAWGWEGLFSQKVFSDPETGVTRHALFLRKDDGAVRQLTADEEALGGASFSRDGKEIVFSADGFLYVMNDDGVNLRPYDLSGSNAQLTVDGALVFGAPEGNISKVWVRWASTGTRSLATGEFPDVSFDGKTIAYDNGAVFVVGIDGNRKRLVAEDGGYPKFLPNGDLVVLRDRAQPELWIVDPDGQREDDRLAVGGNHFVSADGWVVYGAIPKWGVPTKGWYATNPRTRETRFLASGDDGRTYLSVRGNLADSRAVEPRGKLSVRWAGLKRQ